MFGDPVLVWLGVILWTSALPVGGDVTGFAWCGDLGSGSGDCVFLDCEGIGDCAARGDCHDWWSDLDCVDLGRSIGGDGLLWEILRVCRSRSDGGADDSDRSSCNGASGACYGDCRLAMADCELIPAVLVCTGDSFPVNGPYTCLHGVPGYGRTVDQVDDSIKRNRITWNIVVVRINNVDWCVATLVASACRLSIETEVHSVVQSIGVNTTVNDIGTSGTIRVGVWVVLGLRRCY